MSRFFSLGLLIATACSDSGAIPPCDPPEVNQKALDAPTVIGLTGQDILGIVEGDHEVVARWSSGTVSPLRISITRDHDAVEERIFSENRPDCPSVVVVAAEFEMVGAEGPLEARWHGELHAEGTSPRCPEGMISSTARLGRGDFTALPETARRDQYDIHCSFSGGDFSGVVLGTEEPKTTSGEHRTIDPEIIAAWGEGV